MLLLPWKNGLDSLFKEVRVFPEFLPVGPFLAAGRFAMFVLSRLPPGTKPIHAGKNSWGINFRANTCGACIQENVIEEAFLRDFISVQIHVAPVFAPARIQEISPGELFMYWFRARGYMAKDQSNSEALTRCHCRCDVSIAEQ